MNTYVIAKIINSVGLFFDMIGACFIAIEVIKQYKGKKYYSDDSALGGINTDRSPKDTADYKKWEQAKYEYMKIGLGFLLLGFALQILSNWWAEVVEVFGWSLGVVGIWCCQ